MDKPRERLLLHGPHALPDADLLAVILGTGSGRVSAAAAAQAIVRHFPDLRRLAGAGVTELEAIPGVGLAQACRVKAALALGARLPARPLDRGEPIGSASDVHRRIGQRLATLEREVFVAVAMDVKHRVLGEFRVAEGGVCSVDVHPRDAFTAAVREGAAAVLFLHNHPSGDPTPSAEDVQLTYRLRAAGDVLGVRVLDHLVVAQGGYHSFAQRWNSGHPHRVG